MWRKSKKKQLLNSISLLILEGPSISRTYTPDAKTLSSRLFPRFITSCSKSSSITCRCHHYYSRVRTGVRCTRPIKSHLQNKSTAGMTSRKLLWLMSTQHYSLQNFIISLLANMVFGSLNLHNGPSIMPTAPFISHLMSVFSIPTITTVAPQWLIEYAVRIPIQKTCW